MIPKQTEISEPLIITDRSMIMEDKKNRKVSVMNNIPQKFDEF